MSTSQLRQTAPFMGVRKDLLPVISQAQAGCTLKQQSMAVCWIALGLQAGLRASIEPEYKGMTR